MQVSESSNIFFFLSCGNNFFLLQEGKMVGILEAKMGCMLGNLTFVLRFPNVSFCISVNPLKQVH